LLRFARNDGGKHQQKGQQFERRKLLARVMLTP
jgi:hypothetical protein